MKKHTSDEECLSRIVTYDPPPPGFDPRHAPEILLRKHGFPRRPDSATEPRLDRLWQRALARPQTYIKAELAVDRRFVRRQRLTRRSGAFGLNQWAGAIVENRTLDTFPPPFLNTVYGEWTVPSILPPVTQTPTGQTVGYWVGLGGFTDAAPQVLQAGIAAFTEESVPEGGCYAWTEWWTQDYQDPPVVITNFPISVGDRIAVLICTPTPDHGFVAMTNRTTAKTAFIGVPARPNNNADGSSAEWIVESITTDLLDFNFIGFQNVLCGSQENTYDLIFGATDDIVDASGNQETSSLIIGNDIALIFWDASD